MSDEIIKILDDLGERFGVVIDWSSKKVMPYLEDLASRFTSYEVLTSIMWIVIAVIVIIGCSIGIPKVIKYANRKIEKALYYSVWSEGKPFLVGILILLIGIAIIIIITQIIDIITCYTIPEKMILEYLNNIACSS